MSSVMDPKCKIGQKVIIRPVSEQSAPPRDSTIEPYAGQVGEVTDCYWLSPQAGIVFYLYTVRVGKDRGEIALHEDEVEPLRG
ncbi:hypothetical protein ACFLVE_00480 [Chloroflexota bacterium]